MSIKLRDELRAKYGSSLTSTSVETAASGYTCPNCGMKMAGPADSKEALAHRTKMHGKDMTPEKAFVLQSDSGRTIITAPLREIAQINQGFTYLRGRYVEADTPNQNGALWTTDDLQMGAPTVAGGPLNWLHQETKIIGALTAGTLQPGREAAAGEPAIGNHIVSDAVLWSFLYPNETLTIGKAAADGAAYFSMECLSKEVACIDAPGRPGCGETFEYGDYNSGNTCEHLKTRGSVRRFVEPYFLGAAVIVPPVQPGWNNAHVTLSTDNRYAVEAAHLDERLTKPEAESMVSQILAWANR